MNARRMLAHMAEHPEGEKYNGVPESFNWQACRKDVTAIMEAEKENRLSAGRRRNAPS